MAVDCQQPEKVPKDDIILHFSIILTLLESKKDLRTSCQKRKKKKKKKATQCHGFIMFTMVAKYCFLSCCKCFFDLHTDINTLRRDTYEQLDRHRQTYFQPKGRPQTSQPITAPCDPPFLRLLAGDVMMDVLFAGDMTAFSSDASRLYKM